MPLPPPPTCSMNVRPDLERCTLLESAGGTNTFVVSIAVGTLNGVVSRHSLKPFCCWWFVGVKGETGRW